MLYYRFREFVCFFLSYRSDFVVGLISFICRFVIAMEPNLSKLSLDLYSFVCASHIVLFVILCFTVFIVVSAIVQEL